MNIGDIVIEEVTDLGQDALDNQGKYKAMLGVSIRNPFFSKKTMRSYFKWASEQFEELMVLLMDDPDRYNFVALRGLSMDEALISTRSIADDLKAGYEKIIRDLRVDNIHIVQFRDFIEESDYKDFFQKMDSYYKENESFKKAVLEEMLPNVQHKLEHLEGEERMKTIETLSRYMFEEVVALLYFTKKEFLIELDPHCESFVKRLVYKGDFPEILKEVGQNKRGHLNLHPEFNRYEGPF